MSNDKDIRDTLGVFKDLPKANLYCPKCASPLKLIDGGPQNMCGAIMTYECKNPKCKKKWENDQSGISPRATNLTEVL